MERIAEKRLRANEVYSVLRRTYPDATVTLNYTNAFELLIATVLSAQTTDVRVNQVTQPLFSQYASPEKLANAKIADIERILFPLGFYHTKSRNIINLARQLLLSFNGEVPKTHDELVTLPGVGTKTANVVLGNFFDIPAITVDTHVGRLSRRLGFSTQKDPEKVRVDLEKLFENNKRTVLSHLLIAHGRAVCKAPTPLCTKNPSACTVYNFCPRNGIDKKKFEYAVLTLL
ncbi:MAG: endonuclease III [Bifidobacteriaceae bacterium]|jgi:endonuclease-3|nr:endonuclease III [Bifidobacteriaceae bacterium]